VQSLDAEQDPAKPRCRRLFARLDGRRERAQRLDRGRETVAVERHVGGQEASLGHELVGRAQRLVAAHPQPARGWTEVDDLARLPRLPTDHHQLGQRLPLSL
jgi:hypothetical protein